MAKFLAKREMQRSGASWSHEISGDNETVSFHNTFPWGPNELYMEFFSVLVFWHPEGQKGLKKDISMIQKGKLGFRGVKWISLDHFNFWDFLVSVNNHKSAYTSHTHQNSINILAFGGADLMSVMERGCRRWMRKFIASCLLKWPQHESSTKSLPGSVQQLFV